MLAFVLKRIHVNQHLVKSNRRDGTNQPPLTVKTSRANLKAHEVVIGGPSRLVYAPDRPLACGARVWVETRAPVIAIANGDHTEVP